jgi:hypothetical protein
VGPFLKPMVADLGVDRASFSLVIALALFLYGVFMPLMGALVDRVGPRVVTACGSVIFAAALVLTGFCRNLWELALVYGVLASVGLAATGPVVANAVVSRWFVARRGTAVSVLGSAAMTGMSLLVPTVAWLIMTLGWRTTYMVIGLFVLACMLPLSLFVVRDCPETLGLHPDGARARPPATGRVERTPVSDAARSVAFWQLAGSFFTCGFSMSLLSAHGVPMLTDHGYSPLFSSWTFGVLGGLQHSLHDAAGAGVRSLRTTAGPRRHLCRAGGVLRRLLPHPRQSGGHPGRGGVRGTHDGGHTLDDLGAHRRHLRSLLGGNDPRRDLPRPPDRIRARLVARWCALRDDGRLRRDLRDRVHGAARCRRRQPAHRRRRAPRPLGFD